MEFQLQLGMGNLILNGMSLYYGERNGFGLNKWMILCIVNTFAASYFLNYMSKHLNISEFSDCYLLDNNRSTLKYN